MDLSISYLNVCDFQSLEPFGVANTNNKRNIGSFKNSPVHGKKVKREIAYDDFTDDAELLEPVYQNEPLNYDELRAAMNELYPNYEKELHDPNQKRYLGESFLLLKY